MYEQMGQVEEFYKIKPELTSSQLILMSSFNRLSQERNTEGGAPLKIRDKDIHYYQSCNGSHGYAPDLFVIAIREIDQEYITLRCEEIKRKTKGK